MYDSWDMKCDGQFFVILDHFLHLHHPLPVPPPHPPPLTKQKIKILKKWKKQLETSSIYTSVPKIMIICYTVPDIQHVTDVTRSFWAIFCPFTPPPSPPLTQKIQIFKKWKKKSLKILAFYTCVHPCMMDKQVEKVTYRGGCPT